MFAQASLTTNYENSLLTRKLVLIVEDLNLDLHGIPTVVNGRGQIELHVEVDPVVREYKDILHARITFNACVLHSGKIPLFIARSTTAD